MKTNCKIIKNGKEYKARLDDGTLSIINEETGIKEIYSLNRLQEVGITRIEPTTTTVIEVEEETL